VVSYRDRRRFLLQTSYANNILIHSAYPQLAIATLGHTTDRRGKPQTELPDFVRCAGSPAKGRLQTPWEGIVVYISRKQGMLELRQLKYEKVIGFRLDNKTWWKRVDEFVIHERTPDEVKNRRKDSRWCQKTPSLQNPWQTSR
jgi:hypothetical protein